MTLISGWLLAQHTDAVWPYVDSFTTWASVITTVMVAKKILENWLYWLVIDSVSVPLYIDRGLYLTAILFLGYLVIVIFGYFKWRRHLFEQNSLAAPT
jgi:nicotinamide mononucleotide transporter